ncbi:M23 family metallopeptidase [Novosphingobium album (ex Hu et al. 2023)]|uniref:M23 family metallopeptidase n=1 Tax=Novosphingobium album (ex Hu et al. 2023) TaxID=2930093 RepID=A0ABT0B4F4_9SPHN|nr:M23 family metallopeptidase [Novosphingobium album (ex Hu et al. 2023)]MCJ2179927.1 M23 family metallopeptidase [Novosphingobium album (ex Hu et al. 2023)]
MFKALDDNCEDIGGDAGKAAALSHAQVVAEHAVAAPPLADKDEAEHAAEPHPGPDVRPAGLVRRFEAWCARADLAPDLGSDIGSRKWLRGLATLLGLSAVAIAMWPDFSAVEAATGTPVNSRERDEFRSQSIAPLALGADSGRHMGASPLVHPLAHVPERPSIQLVSTLGQGDSFGRMLERAGVGGSDISRITELVGNAVPVSDITSGTQFDITLGKRPAANAPRALDSMDFRARFDLDLSIERGADGALSLVRHPITVDATPLRIRGTVGSSLYRSARNAGAPVAAIQSYLRAVDKYINLEDGIGASDEYDMIVAYKRSAKGEHEVGDLLYAGLERDGKSRLQLLRWGKDGQMFAASSIGQPRSVPIGQPVAGRITSTYGMRRHPILGYVRMHAGIDFGAAYGSPIYAVADGRVTYAGRHGGHGNYVRIQHSGGLGTGYGHMSRIAVANGAHVRAGQVIGYVGSTGLSTGPHLHFEAYRNGHTINPAGISIIARPQIDGKERDAFKAQLRALLGVEPGAALAPIAQPESEHAEAEREIDRLAPRKVG